MAKTAPCCPPHINTGTIFLLSLTMHGGNHAPLALVVSDIVFSAGGGVRAGFLGWSNVTRCYYFQQLATAAMFFL